MIVSRRMTTGFDGPLVVFVIGMRINHVHKLTKWLPVLRAMPRMLSELAADPDSGFIGSDFLFRGPRSPVLIQYWRDFERLEAYALSRDRAHWPAWTAFNKAVGNDGTVGIYHETFTVERGNWEVLYVNMPPTGLGKVTGLIPATGSRTEARSRMKAAVAGD